MSHGDNRAPHTQGEGRARPALTLLSGVVGVIEWTGKVIAFAMLAFTFVTLFVNVFLRYAFGSGIPWAYEIHAVSLPWLVAGGVVIAAARSRNITISLLPDMLNPDHTRILLVLVNLAIALIAAKVLWESQPILKASTFQTLSTLGIKQVWGYTSLVYAFGAMSLIAAIDIVRLLLAPPPETRDPAHTSLS